MSKGITFDTYLVEKFLQDPERAKGYLREALEEGDLKLLQMSVENLIKAGYESFKFIAKQSSKKQETDNFLDTAEIELTEKAVKAKI